MKIILLLYLIVDVMFTAIICNFNLLSFLVDVGLGSPVKIYINLIVKSVCK